MALDFSFFAGAPDTSPLSAPAMEMRRRIALQMMANSGKRGYPRNVGEGIASIGDAIGQRMSMNQLARQEAAYQAQAAKTAAAAMPGAGAQTPPIVNQSSADDEKPEDAPVQTAAQEAAVAPQVVAGGPQPNPISAEAPASASQPSEASTPEDGGQQPDQRLALLSSTGTISDAPAILPSQIRPAPPDPTIIKPAPAVPPTGPAAPPPVQVAQAAQGAPTPPSVPQATGITNDERRGYQIRAQGLALGDPDMAKQGQNLIDYGAQRRAQADAQLKALYDQKMEIYKHERGEYETAPKRAAELTRAQEEATAVQQANRLRAGFGNMPPDEVFKQLNTSQATAKSAAQAIVGLQNAKDAFDRGIIGGQSADWRLTLNKTLGLLGKKSSGDLAADTELFKATMQPIVASILHQTSGTSQLSEGELRFAKAAAAGDISLEPGAVHQLLNILDKANRTIITDHSKRIDTLFGSDNVQARTLLGVEMPPALTTASKPLPGVVDVKSEEEAARLPKGTKVRINGRTGTVQ